MPMPHRTQMQLIKRRLVGKEGAERVRSLKAALVELPDYRSGPCADIRKWINAELEATRRRAGVIHRDSIAVRREGAARIALVGPPNAGKSSLLQALSQLQIKTGDYAFTTTRPVAALVRLQGVLIQLVEIPGLIAGANSGRGGGRALLGVLRASDAVLLCHDVTAPFADLATVRAELEAGGIDLPTILAATKLDEASPAAFAELARACPDLEAIAVSVLDDASLDELRAALWRLTGLNRIFLRRDGETDPEPVGLRPPVDVAAVAATIHHELAANCLGGRIWGGSGRFPGQRVGRAHELADGDTVEILV